IEITTRSSIRVKPRWPHHRRRYPDMAHLLRHSAILVQQRSDHAIPGGTEPVPGPLHQAIDPNNPGVMETEVVTGDGRPSDGGAAGAVVRKRNALLSSGAGSDYTNSATNYSRATRRQIREKRRRDTRKAGLIRSLQSD